VPGDAELILAARITAFAMSMGSEGSAEVEYAVYAPRNPTPLQSWTVHTSRAFLNAAGVSTIASAADMAAAVKVMITDNAEGVTPTEPGGNAGVLRSLSGRLQSKNEEEPAQPVEKRAADGRSAERPPARQLTGMLAVLEFKNKLKGSDAETVDTAYFSNAVRAAVKREAPTIKVMTRENILVILQSSGKNLADCEGECEVDTGRRLGADWVISGDILKVGSSYKLDLRLHDTHEAQLLNGTAATGHSVDELDRDTPRAIADLLRTLR
jgi:hypothetical protein